MMHYINTNGIRGRAMGGVLLSINDVKAVGDYWPASKEDNAHFHVYLKDGQTICVSFAQSVPVTRQLEEHALLVKELVSRNRRPEGGQCVNYIDFEPAEKSVYDATDPDGARLIAGRALGALVAYLYQSDPSDIDDRKQDLTEQAVAISLVEKFAVKVFGDSLAMDEFSKARDETIWDESADDILNNFVKPL